jgi:tetratricopeptide (TPR) repeat protein
MLWVCFFIIFAVNLKSSREVEEVREVREVKEVKEMSKKVRKKPGVMEKVNTLTMAIEREPENANAYFKRGIEYHRAGMYKLAILDYIMAKKLNPELAPLLVKNRINNCYKNVMLLEKPDWPYKRMNENIKRKILIFEEV